LRQTGAYLRQLHALTAPTCLAIQAYGYLGEHHPMEPQRTWESAFHVMWNRLLDDVVASGCYSLNEARALRELFERHRAHFGRPVVPRLLHMDVWSQNILVDAAANVSGLVDFDRALWGDMEIEFAVLDYCGMSEPSFWAGYGMQRDESAPALIRRQFYLLYEVQKYMPLCIWRGKDPVGVRDFKRQSLALAARLGLMR
jgi:fructosamine-3-kinase